MVVVGGLGGMGARASTRAEAQQLVGAPGTEVNVERRQAHGGMLLCETQHQRRGGG